MIQVWRHPTLMLLDMYGRAVHERTMLKHEVRRLRARIRELERVL